MAARPAVKHTVHALILIAFDEGLPPALFPAALTVKPVKRP